MLLRALEIPALLVTATDTGVGKTLVAGAIADWFRRRAPKPRVAVCKRQVTLAMSVRVRTATCAEPVQFGSAFGQALET